MPAEPAPDDVTEMAIVFAKHSSDARVFKHSNVAEANAAR